MTRLYTRSNVLTFICNTHHRRGQKGESTSIKYVSLLGFCTRKIKARHRYMYQKKNGVQLHRWQLGTASELCLVLVPPTQSGKVDLWWSLVGDERIETVLLFLKLL